MANCSCCFLISMAGVVQPLRGNTAEGALCTPHSRWRVNVGLTSCDLFKVVPSPIARCNCTNASISNHAMNTPLQLATVARCALHRPASIAENTPDNIELL